jgi:hypothetical protein
MNSPPDHCLRQLAEEHTVRTLKMGKHTHEQRKEEWQELYRLTKRALQPFGTDDEAGGDYFVIDLVPNDKVQMVELHKLHMLRPQIIKSLHDLLADFPDWQIEVFVVSPEENVVIDPESGLILRPDGIIDALDREELPKQYRFEYEGSRRPPKDFKL